jgi:hypothetical protein
MIDKPLHWSLNEVAFSSRSALKPISAANDYYDPSISLLVRIMLDHRTKPFAGQVRRGDLDER